ncbi:MAG: NAD-dependent epimerase/dehydratase family protein [Planctomycetaceae bacterium]|nr:MAG: NAD-dependent epimerase/dehydratase family protein [Planctomycetaceae bacterium]
MYLNDRLIFLAGATGLAGSSILEYIISNHPKTKIRAAYHRTKPFIKDERIEYIRGDLRSREDCRKMAKGCDCAIIAAANTGG